MYMISSENIRLAEIFDSLIFKWLKIKKWKNNKHVHCTGKIEMRCFKIAIMTTTTTTESINSATGMKVTIFKRTTYNDRESQKFCLLMENNKHILSASKNVPAAECGCWEVNVNEWDRKKSTEPNIIQCRHCETWTVNAHSKCPTIVLQLNLNLTKQSIEWIFEIIPLLYISIGKNVIWAVGK